MLCRVTCAQRRFASVAMHNRSCLPRSSLMLLPVAASAASRTTGVTQLQQRRSFIPGTVFGANMSGHLFSGLSIAGCAATPLASPYGTALMVALSYNVSVVGLKHLWYTLEMTIRDYIQDVVVAQMMRYMILLTLMTCVFQLFIEA